MADNMSGWNQEPELCRHLLRSGRQTPGGPVWNRGCTDPGEHLLSSRPPGSPHRRVDDGARLDTVAR
ncbi:hypothetical protein [Micromonospora citrea]|uniref:hypothetical protein n=1 Tax=Micromonospora citrea TaxID=47855 RepID=UPI00114C895A|nr:hypothetical protein [Micromonospora citrea]